MQRNKPEGSSVFFVFFYQKDPLSVLYLSTTERPIIILPLFTPTAHAHCPKVDFSKRPMAGN